MGASSDFTASTNWRNSSSAVSQNWRQNAAPPTFVPSHPTKADTPPGTLVYLPARNAFATNSIIFGQIQPSRSDELPEAFTKGTFSHPAVVVGWNTTSNGEDIAICHTITSFGGKSVQDRFPQHPEFWGKVRHIGRNLRLAPSSRSPAKQSYVLPWTFMVEAKHLRFDLADARHGSAVVLDSAAVADLNGAFGLLLSRPRSAHAAVPLCPWSRPSMGGQLACHKRSATA